MSRRRTKRVGSTRSLGARYGSTVRKRYAKVIEEMKKVHNCPQCSSEKVRRQSVGVWKCRKCGFTFAGGAYTPSTKLGVIAKRTSKGSPSLEVSMEENSGQ